MPTRYVIDASVFVADAVITEPFHNEANQLLEALAWSGVELLLPAIVLPEIAAAIARGVGDPQLAQEAVALYRRWPGVTILPVDEALADQAARIAATNRIRGCDAVYVALAEAFAALLVTLDKQQRARAPARISALTPDAALAQLTKP
jgi:predicted nucleic acid-binding protein